MTDLPLALVIEDDMDAAFIFAKAMSENGFQVENINDGEKAAARLQEVNPQVILLDLHLPNVPGAELLRQIRDAAHLANTRVVLITADPRTAESVEKQADLVLLKPVTFSQVRDLVKRVMKKQTATLVQQQAHQSPSAQQPQS